eukprot:GEMP01025139.1.p1 GENE.GEMP01025139.1~~GEMP01025139.1.p1  ORF type:complete len:393 (+),score=66.24 GEMP01025139.1:429-1607(+)
MSRNNNLSLKICRPAERAARALFTAIDKDHNEFIDFEEYLRWLDLISMSVPDSCELMSMKVPDRCLVPSDTRFDKLDVNNDKKIDIEEWLSSMSSVFEILGKKEFCEVINSQVLKQMCTLYAKIVNDLAGDHLLHSVVSSSVLSYDKNMLTLSPSSMPIRTLEKDRTPDKSKPIQPFKFIATKAARVYKIQVADGLFLAVEKNILTAKNVGADFEFVKAVTHGSPGELDTKEMDIFNIKVGNLFLCEKPRKNGVHTHHELALLPEKQANALRPFFQIEYFNNQEDLTDEKKDLMDKKKPHALVPILMHIREQCIREYRNTRRAFSMFDSNQSGWISHMELEIQLKRWNLTKRESEVAFDFIDDDHDGAICEAEFEACMECLVLDAPLQQKVN